MQKLNRAQERNSFLAGTQPLGRNVGRWAERAPRSRWALAHAERHEMYSKVGRPSIQTQHF